MTNSVPPSGSPHDFAESFTLKDASALIGGLSPRFHGSRGSPPILDRMRTDAGKGLLNVVDGRAGREEIHRWLQANNLQSEYAFGGSTHRVTGNDPDAPLKARERSTFQKLVIGMAKGGYGYDPKAAKSPIPVQISADLAKMGIMITDDTVRKYLKAAAEAELPRNSS